MLFYCQDVLFLFEIIFKLLFKHFRIVQITLDFGEVITRIAHSKSNNLIKGLISQILYMKAMINDLHNLPE